MSGFEGSFLGKTSRIEAGSVLECGVCWWVYDPARGDVTWQVPPGTPFADLPEHWRCPNCDTARAQFMVVERGSEAPRRSPAAAAGQLAVEQGAARLLQAYSEAATRMRSLPVYNHKLDIRVIGLRRCAEGLVGIVATPWCMNIVLLPGADTPARMEGTAREVAFPSGQYRFVAGRLEGVGPIESCSLFSPMDAFDDPEVVAEVAAHAVAELFEPAPDPGISRRDFLRVGKERTGESAPE